MPEGHTVHRLARTFAELFGGQPLAVTSPQGRFAAGAALLDGRTLADAEAWGKQMFLRFEGPDPEWLRVHLGLYGAWTFAGDESAVVAHAIGAPRKRVGEGEKALPALVVAEEGGPDADQPDATGGGSSGDFVPPPPRGQVRVRIASTHAVADLTGPTACEVIGDDERAAALAKLGPDPIRAGTASPKEAAGLEDRFVARVQRSRTAVGVQLMDQGVSAGVGNIYRAEALYRARLDPARPGATVPAEDLRALWRDLVALMTDGVERGAIVSTLPEHRGLGHERGLHRPSARPGRVRQNTDAEPDAVPSEEAFYVYHRDGLACRVCGTTVLVREVAGRNLFWCPGCQR